MSQWVEVAELAEVSRRKRKLVVVGEQRIALFYAEGQVYAFQDACVHKDRSLARGTALHGRVICPGHQWAFDLRTGQAEDRAECQPTYEAKVEDGSVWLIPRPRHAGTAAAPSPFQLVQE
jgi:nitrite reductase (NADH) small subunit